MAIYATVTGLSENQIYPNSNINRLELPQRVKVIDYPGHVMVETDIGLFFIERFVYEKKTLK